MLAVREAQDGSDADGPLLLLRGGKAVMQPGRTRVLITAPVLSPGRYKLASLILRMGGLALVTCREAALTFLCDMPQLKRASTGCITIVHAFVCLFFTVIAKSLQVTEGQDECGTTTLLVVVTPLVRMQIMCD